jgi:hypothetical protein
MKYVNLWMLNIRRGKKWTFRANHSSHCVKVMTYWMTVGFSDWAIDYHFQCKFDDELDFRSYQYSISDHSRICFSLWHFNRGNGYAAYSCCSHCCIYLKIVARMTFKIQKIVPFDLNFRCVNNQVYSRAISRLDIPWFRVCRNWILMWYTIAGTSTNCARLVDRPVLDLKWLDHKHDVTQNIPASEVQKSWKSNYSCKELIISFVSMAGWGRYF